MLKLEIARDRNIRISVRDKGPPISGSFLIALAIALGLHLFALVLFRIAPFFITSDRVLQPTAIEADLTQMFDESENGVIAYASEEKSQRHSLRPPVSSPYIPSMPVIKVDRKMEYPKNKDVFRNTFLSIEEESMDLISLNGPGPEKVQPIRIHVSGELAGRTLIDDARTVDLAKVFSDGKLGGKGAPDHYVAVYQVQVERSGRIFWHLAKKSMESPKLNRIAEQMLQQMRFQDEAYSVNAVSTGDIEIVFTLPKKSRGTGGHG